MAPSVEHGRPLSEVLNRRQTWLLLGSLMLAMFVAAIDQTVVTTAAPRILADLGGFNLLSWLFTTYMLSSTVVMPLVGKLTDIYGRKNFLMGGILLFMVSSLACGAAPNMMSLIAFRTVQGIGGGVLFACVFSTLADIFPPIERGKYMGLFTGTFSLASVLGPLAGGFLTDHGGWRLVFYINVPFSLIAIPAIWLNLPARKGAKRVQIDYVGAILLAVASVALLLAFEWAGREYDWGSPQILGLLGATLVLVVVFLVQERRHPEPVIPTHLFRNRTFVTANVIMVIMSGALFGSLQYLSLFVQTALGKSATGSGVISTPQSIGMVTASVLGGQLISRTGRYRYQTILGTLMLLSAALLLRTVDVGMPLWQIGAFMVLLGLGFGMTMPSLSVVVQNAVPQSLIGVGTSSSQFFRQIGGVVGVALFAAVLTSTYRDNLAEQIPPDRQAQLGSTYASFNDPTLPLNKSAFAEVQGAVRALPGGDELLATTLAAQREAVATGVRRIFTFSAIAVAFAVALAVLQKEVRLRRDFLPARGDAGEPPRGAEVAIH